MKTDIQRKDSRIKPEVHGGTARFTQSIGDPKAFGEGVHSHTDRDSWNAVGEDGWAGLIYLSKGAERQSGLRTWENVEAAHTLDWMTPSGNWILRDTFANVYNRLILHRGGIPHSGSPGWGNTVEDGRLFQTSSSGHWLILWSEVLT